MFVYTSLVTLTLPLLVWKLVGDQDKGQHLGLITAGAAFFDVGILYVFGRFRDQKSRIIQGTNLSGYGLGLMLPGCHIVGRK